MSNNVSSEDETLQIHQETPQFGFPTQTFVGNDHHVPPQATTIPTSRSGLGKLLHKPSEYDGSNRNACTTFLAQLKLYMHGNAESFPTEESKVLFAATYLRGKAFSWFEPRMVRGTDPLLSDFELFCSELLRNLGDPDQQATMARKLKALKQTTSAAAYRTEFDNTSQYLSWDSAALKSYYYDGLSAAVKDALALIPDPPEDLNTFQDLTIKIDQRLYERRQESRGASHATIKTTAPLNRTRPTVTSTRFNATRPTVPQYSGGAPMDLDATRNKRFKPLTPQERQRRISNNLCLYCGGPGHSASGCPVKVNLQKSGRIHAVLTAPPSKPSKN